MDVERPEVELLRRLHPVHLGHHPVAADAPDVEAVEPEAGDVVLDVDARLVLDEIGKVPDQAFLHRLAVDDRNHARRLSHRRGTKRRRHGHRIQEGEGIVGWLNIVRVRNGRRPARGLLVAGVLLRQDGCRSAADRQRQGHGKAGDEGPRDGTSHDASVARQDGRRLDSNRASAVMRALCDGSAQRTSRSSSSPGACTAR